MNLEATLMTNGSSAQLSPAQLYIEQQRPIL